MLPTQKGTVMKAVSTGLRSYHRVAGALEVLGKWCREEVQSGERSLTEGASFEGAIV
jgi:hypothetical protein